MHNCGETKECYFFPHVAKSQSTMHAGDTILMPRGVVVSLPQPFLTPCQCWANINKSPIRVPRKGLHIELSPTPQRRKQGPRGVMTGHKRPKELSLHSIHSGAMPTQREG